MPVPSDVTLADKLRLLEDSEAKLRGEVAPGVFAFGALRPMGRIRAYTSAGLGPFAGRGMPNEILLLGHVHFAPDGSIARVEGFNGPDGEKWAKQASDRAKAQGIAADKMVVQPLTPLRSCPHTGIR